MAKVDVKTKRNDWQISGLIETAQEYANPAEQIPEPPPTSSLASDDAQERTRPPTPDWFEPRDHPSDRDEPPEGDAGDVPVIDGEGEVPEPSAGEQSSIDAFGIDALAYYAPFHFYGRTFWGIYIRDYGIAYLTSRFLGRRMLTPSDNWALRCAYWLLFEHEYFHFQTEIAATRHEVLTRELKTYERLFHDGQASWLEESMANARAYYNLPDHEDGTLTFSRIEHFKGFASSWMKTQPAGYRDYDRWCKSQHSMNKGRAALTSRVHEISRHYSRSVVSADALRLFEGADYSRVPVVRVHDTRIPWLKAARLFPKALGMQVLVYTRDHPPPHIHVEFMDSDKVVRLGWPSLAPLRGESTLSAREEKDLRAYLQNHFKDIDRKVQKVFHLQSLARAV
jgi:hypothetical protein